MRKSRPIGYFSILPVCVVCILTACAATPVREPETADPGPSESREQSPETLTPEHPAGDLGKSRPDIVQAVLPAVPSQTDPVVQRLPVPEPPMSQPEVPLYPWHTDQEEVSPVPVVEEVVTVQPRKEQADIPASGDGPARPAIPAASEGSEGQDMVAGASAEPEMKTERSTEGTEEVPVQAESLEVETGTPFDYVLEGEGWVFEKSEPAGVRLIKRTISTGETEFTFFIPEEETYMLSFLFTDILEDRFERAVLQVSAISEKTDTEDDWDDELHVPEEDTVPEEPAAEEVVALGFYEALQEADRAVKSDRYRRALEILLLCAEEFSHSRNIDRVYFALGSLYEKPGPARDITRSLFYYKKITENFPASIFYNSAAERIVYLERNFIRIR